MPKVLSPSDVYSRLDTAPPGYRSGRAGPYELRARQPWQPPVKPSGAQAMHPIREISPRLNAAIISAGASTPRVASAERLDASMLFECHAPVLPRISPLKGQQAIPPL